MAYYRIFEGGNYSTLSPVGNIMTASRDGITHGEYAGHIKTRHRVPQFHFDRSSTGIQQWFNEINKKDLEIGVDEISLSWLLDGSIVNNVIFHNKSAVEGTSIQVTMYGGASDEPDAELSEDDVIFTQEVSLGQVGYTKLNVPENLLLQTNSEITIKLLSGSLQGTCFTLSPDVVHHNDGHRCSCAPICCETEYPRTGCISNVRVKQPAPAPAP